ncbi:hypothetical protein RJ640_020216 [Escallonia rubra]|uniref:CCHC-type domain-containing protein n=1 Tax=Escallonia rubra TaxID=112253 RepID=A0AA88QWZ1_9ASTE|nr:hypothetical protein RJ640_020216 [Escallonia rubra]
MAAGNNTSLNIQQPNISIFDGEQYEEWRVKMRTLFVSHDVWELVENGYEDPDDISTLTLAQQEKLRENRKKDAKALYFIQVAVSTSIFPRIIGANRSKEAWDTLKNEFQGSEKVRTIKLQTFRREFENLRMKDSESLQDYFSRLMELVNQMKINGEQIADKRIVEKILISLPEKFDPIVAVIEESKDLSTLNVHELMGSLKMHEQRLTRHIEKSIESAFQTKLTISSKSPEKEHSVHEFNKGEASRGGRQGRGRGRNSRGRGRGRYTSERFSNSDFSPMKCNICKRIGHLERNCWFKGKPQCHNCKKFGHIKKDCRFLDNQQAKFSEEKEGEDNMFYACQMASEQKKDVWYLDSGCSNHMTSNRGIFVDIDSSVNSQIIMGNGSIVKAKGKGTIAIQAKEATKYIRDVLLVPDLEQNLLSVGQLVEHGYMVHFEDNGCKIYDKRDGKKVMANVKMEKSRNFPISFHYPRYNALKVEVKNESWLWHKRYGHLNFQSLRSLQQKEMVYGLPKIESKKDIYDLIVTGSDEKMVHEFKSKMMKRYEMNDLGLLHYFLGIEIQQTEGGIFICQKKYGETILKKFKMYGCKSVGTPLVVDQKIIREDGSGDVNASLFRSLVGSLLYLSATRPDIMYATSLLSRFMLKPSRIHYGAAKRVLRYIQGTLDFGIMYKKNEKLQLSGFCDSDWAGSVDDMRSTSGYAFSLGSGMFSWASKKQQTVAQSSAEAEYVAAAVATSQAIWLRRILGDMGEEQAEATTLLCDNKSAIAMTKNPGNHCRTKHINIKYHFVREAVENGEVQFQFCKTEDQVADVFTKAIPKERLDYFRLKLGVQQQSIKGQC